MRLTTHSSGRLILRSSRRPSVRDASSKATATGAQSVLPTSHGAAHPATSGKGRARRVVLAPMVVVVLGLAAALTVGAPAALAAPPGVAASRAVRVVALAGSVDDVLNNIRNWIMGILAGLATVFLTIGGMRYVMAAGDPGEVAKAKIAFKSAATGYALAALAPLVVTVLKGIVGA